MQTDPVLSPVSEEIVAAAEASANFVTVDQVRAFAEQADLTEEQVNAVVIDYADAQITSLKSAFAGIAIFALLALVYVHRLPKKASFTKDPGKKRAKPKTKARRHK